MDVVEIAYEFRSKLLQGNNEALKDLALGFRRALDRVQAELERLGQEIELARSRGEEIGPAWLFQYDRLGTLQRRLEAELDTLYNYLAGQVITQQAQAVDLGIEYARKSLEAQADVLFTYPDPAALRMAVGFMREGPVREVLERRAGKLAEELARTIQAGIILGRNPREIAREVKDTFGLQTVHALTLARTETLRAYREAVHQAIEANQDVVRGWIWHAHPSKRTCAVCLAKHGSFFYHVERMTSHPNCRCSPIPVTREWSTVLLRKVRAKETAFTRTWSGSAYFMRLPAEEQIEKIGLHRFLLHRFHDLSLQDMVMSYADPKWGLQSKLIPVTKFKADFNTLRQWWAEVGPIEKQFRETLEKLANEIVGAVKDTFGLESRWTGSVYVTKYFEGSAFGTTRWDWGITVRPEVIKNRALMIKVLAHEALHTVSNAFEPAAYIKLRGYEEGPVEALARELYERRLREMYDLAEPQTRFYETYVNAFHKIARARSLDVIEFLVELLKTPLSDRPDLLRKVLKNDEVFGYWHEILANR